MQADAGSQQLSQQRMSLLLCHVVYVVYAYTLVQGCPVCLIVVEMSRYSYTYMAFTNITSRPLFVSLFSYLFPLLFLLSLLVLLVAFCSARIQQWSPKN